MDPTYGINAEKTSWLGLDPGVTTGWALLDQGGKLLGSGTFDESQVFEGVDRLIRGCHRGARSVHVVVEKMPPGSAGRLSERLERVRSLIFELVTDVYELPVTHVPPGEWTNSRVAKITRWPQPFRTDHEHDAATMALYTMDKEKRSAARSD
jgi:hypothetical protein